MTFVIVEVLASEQQGRTLYYKQMVSIGPMTTPERDEAMEFASKDDANRCPALYHPLCMFEVQEET